MPGPDQRTVRTNRRPRRRAQFSGASGRLPVTEHEEMQEIEAARERNDIDVAELRESSAAELRQLSRERELDSEPEQRKDDLVDRILQRQIENAVLAYATG